MCLKLAYLQRRVHILKCHVEEQWLALVVFPNDFS